MRCTIAARINTDVRPISLWKGDPIPLTTFVRHSLCVAIDVGFGVAHMKIDRDARCFEELAGFEAESAADRPRFGYRDVSQAQASEGVMTDRWY